MPRAAGIEKIGDEMGWNGSGCDNFGFGRERKHPIEFNVAKISSYNEALR
jgi:hypothetical protein